VKSRSVAANWRRIIWRDSYSFLSWKPDRFASRQSANELS
jgi:hypothetical protein